MTINGQKIEVTTGLSIFYIKVGHGPKVVLFLPGGCGTAISDFTPQMENFDHEKFTIIAWDPPGYGNSRPPKREYKLERTYSKDADVALELMKKLGYTKYSLMGWSDGGKTAMLMAIKKPAIIQSMVIFGCGAYITETEQRALAAIEDLKEWDPKTLAPYLNSYKWEEFQEMWSEHLKCYRKMRNICKERVNLISCPVFLLGGGKDPLGPPEHAQYLSSEIRNIKVHIFPDGGHNIHHVYENEFNSMTQTFLLTH